LAQHAVTTGTIEAAIRKLFVASDLPALTRIVDCVENLPLPVDEGASATRQHRAPVPHDRPPRRLATRDPAMGIRASYIPLKTALNAITVAFSLELETTRINV
jgi:hypothetical protein